MVPADRRLGSDAGAVSLASARGSYRTIARCCRHRDARLQVGASRAFGSLRALGTTVAARGSRVLTALTRTVSSLGYQLGPGTETCLSQEAKMRVDAVPQPASSRPLPSRPTVRTGAGKRYTRRGTEPWQEAWGAGSILFQKARDPGEDGNGVQLDPSPVLAGGHLTLFISSWGVASQEKSARGDGPREGLLSGMPTFCPLLTS